MDSEILIKNLKNSWKKVYLWKDKPNELYGIHSHDYDVKLIILEGDIGIKLHEKEIELSAGNEIHIKPFEEHEATVGKYGCTYIVAEVRKT